MLVRDRVDQVPRQDAGPLRCSRRRGGIDQLRVEGGHPDDQEVVDDVGIDLVLGHSGGGAVASKEALWVGPVHVRQERDLVVVAEVLARVADMRELPVDDQRRADASPTRTFDGWQSPCTSASGTGGGRCPAAHQRDVPDYWRD